MAKFSNYTTIAESEIDDEYKNYLKEVVKVFERVFKRWLSFEECVHLAGILELYTFTTKNGFVINSLNDSFGKYDVAAIAGCFHGSEERHSADWWKAQILNESLSETARDDYLKLLGEIVSHVTIVKTE